MVSKKSRYKIKTFGLLLCAACLLVLFYMIRIAEDIGDVDKHPQPTRYTQYHFEAPAAYLLLEPSLLEISGLSYTPKEDVLTAINDEEGKIFSLNPATGNIIKATSFGRKADYEAIEVLNETIYILESGGSITKYDATTEQSQTILTSLLTNEIEGLTTSVDKQKLIIACKGQTPSGMEGEKVIVSYDIATEKIDKDPFLSIYIDDIRNMARDIYNDQKGKSAIEKRIKKFAPSGIAIDPQNQDIYIISGRGSSLVVYDKEKQIRDVFLFEQYKMPQPEGICFDNNGTLYISSEGKGSPGSLSIFRKDN